MLLLTYDRTLIGRVTIYSGELQSLRGDIIRPILNSNFEVIGTFTGRFLVITPLLHPKNTIAVSQRYPWGNCQLITQTHNPPGPVIPDIGHRGMGENKTSRICNYLLQ
jgi:hypothetical protein